MARHVVSASVGVAVMAASVVVALLESPLASATSTAPDVTGKKYSDAQSAASAAGYSPVVVTTFGDQRAWSDCLVTRTQKRTAAPPANSSGSPAKQLLISLNCDADVASPTKAGNSAGSPEGRAAIAVAASAASSPSG
jgi:hypothetical protein